MRILLSLGLSLVALAVVMGVTVDSSFSQSIDEDSKTNKDQTLETYGENNDDKKEKFDEGFYDKMADKIDLKNKMMSQGLDVSDEMTHHEVIILVDRYDFEDKDKTVQNMSGQKPVMAKKDVSTENKLKILSELIDKHGVSKYANAQMLSFVTAQVPVGEIPKLADYDYVRMIGDGQLRAVPSSDASGHTATAPALSGIPAGLDGTGVKVVMLSASTDLQSDMDLQRDALLSSYFHPSNVINHAFCDVTGCAESALSDSDMPYDADDVNGHLDDVDDVNMGIMTDAEDILKSLGEKEKENYINPDFDEILSVAPGISLLSAKVQSASGVVHAYDWTLANNARILNQGIHAEEKQNVQSCTEGVSKTVALVADEMADAVFDDDDGVVLVVDNARNGDDDEEIRPAGTPDRTCSYKSITVSDMFDDGRLADADIITAPRISGAAAILFEENPFLTADQLRAALLAGIN